MNQQKLQNSTERKVTEPEGYNFMSLTIHKESTREHQDIGNKRLRIILLTSITNSRKHVSPTSLSAGRDLRAIKYRSR